MGAARRLIDSRVNDTSGYPDLLAGTQPAGAAPTSLPAVQRVLLGLILLAGLALRVWNNDYGLPFVYSIDEASHFTDRAVLMFREGIDPGYYQNPAAYTYLLYALLRVMYGPLQIVFDLPFGNVTDQFSKDPTQIWIAARTLAAVLCMAGVAAVWWAARRLWGAREGLIAAAVLAFAFLPVAYSRVAVTDVGVLIGVSLALCFAVRVYEDGRLRDYALAGAAAGLAIAFKYTAGLVLLPLGIAALARIRADRLRALAGLAAAAGLAGLVFVVLNPYLFGSFDSWWEDLRGQAEVAADQPKPGQESGGLSYYLHSLTWGLGWAGCAAALAGAAIELRRNLVRGLILIALPLALLIYLSVQSRYFGRWLLPAYPALAMLAAVGIARVAAAVAAALPRAKEPMEDEAASERVAAADAPRRAATHPDRRTRRPAPWTSSAVRSASPTPRRLALIAGVLTAATLAQPLAADIRTVQVLGRTDTREQARDFLVSNYPPGLRVSIEPAVPGRWYRTNPTGHDPPWLRRCEQKHGWTEPGWSYPGPAGTRACERYRPGQFARPDGGVRASAYHLVLRPQVIDEYRFYGYCLVVTFGTVRERAEETGSRAVRAYYDRLERESTLLRRFSPYDPGATPVPFDFDLSFNYEPAAYHRPGPVVTIQRLNDCRQAYGTSLIQVPGAVELPPFAPRDEENVGDEL
jgi:hypothetical protein